MGAKGTALGWRDRQHGGGSGSIPSTGKKENEGARAELLKIAESSGERLKAFTGHVGEERKLSPERWG